MSALTYVTIKYFIGSKDNGIVVSLPVSYES